MRSRTRWNKQAPFPTRGFRPNWVKLIPVLTTFRIYKNLAWLNDLPRAEAESVFMSCCGSTVWAGKMTAARPFSLLGDLFDSADKLWVSLPAADQLEGYAANAESAATLENGKLEIAEQFDAARRLYEEKFGFIFVVNKNGKTINELLALCRARFGNSAQTELNIAADEMRRIIESRLIALLER